MTYAIKVKLTEGTAFLSAFSVREDERHHAVEARWVRDQAKALRFATEFRAELLAELVVSWCCVEEARVVEVAA